MTRAQHISLAFGTVAFLAVIFGGLAVDLLFPVDVVEIGGEEGDLRRTRLDGGFFDGKTARRFEDRFERRSRLAATLRPRINQLVVETFETLPNDIVGGRDAGWLFLKKYLEGCAEAPPERIDARAAWVKAIVNILQARGTHVVVVPVPNKSAVAPKQLPKDRAEVGDVTTQRYRRFLGSLRTGGVDVVDVLAELEAIDADQRFHPSGTHWKPRAIRRVAERVAERIIRIDDFEILTPKVKTRIDDKGENEYVSDLTRRLDLPEGSDARTKYLSSAKVFEVRRDPGGRRYRKSKGADIALAGTSMSDNRSFAAYIAHYCERGVDDHAKLGSGPTATLAKIVRESLSGKRPWPRVIVWEFIQYHASNPRWTRWAHRYDAFLAAIRPDESDAIDLIAASDDLSPRGMRAAKEGEDVVIRPIRNNASCSFEDFGRRLPGDGTFAIEIVMSADRAGVVRLFAEDARFVETKIEAGDHRLMLPVVAPSDVTKLRLNFAKMQGARIQVNGIRLLRLKRP